MQLVAFHWAINIGQLYDYFHDKQSITFAKPVDVMAADII